MQVRRCAPGLIALGEVGAYFGGLSAARIAERHAHISVQLLTARARHPRVRRLAQQAMAVAVAIERLFQHAGLQTLVETVKDVSLSQRDEAAQQSVANI